MWCLDKLVDYWPVKLVAFDISDIVRLPPVIGVALPPVMLPINPMLSVVLMLACCAANAAGDAIPTTKETAATILTIAIKFNLYMQL